MIFIIAFAFVIGAAWFSTRIISGKMNSVMKGRYLSIIESISLGTDKRIVLIRAGSKYLLLSLAGKNLQMLCEIDIDEAGTEERSKDFKYNLNRIKEIIKEKGLKKDGSN